MEEISIRSIQHFLFCPHRWGMIEIDRAWAENYFVAPDCMHIHFEGYYDKYANPLRLAEEGFFGLESE